MRIRSFTLLLALPLIGMAATTFRLTPIHLGNGYVVTGTIETDGSIGYLTPAKFTKWKITVTQTTDTVFTERTTSAANIQQVSSDGKKLTVPTSPDGFTDGGFLGFLSPARAGSIPSGALVADFSGVNIAGGVSGWQTPLALNYAYLNQPDAITYTAATATRTGAGSVFNITPVTISTAPTVITMFGTITTDGAVGFLTPKNFKSWHIVGREQDIQQYNETNSQILAAQQIFSDNSDLKVMKPGGVLQIGIPGSVRGRPIIVTIADFTDPTYVNGVASYYYGFNGLVAEKSPLTTGQTYVIGKH